MYKSLNEFEILPDATTGFHGNQIGLQWEKRCHHIFFNFLIGIISYLQVMMIYIRAFKNELDIRRDPTMDYGVGCPWASEKNPIDL